MTKIVIFWMCISLLFECIGDFFVKKWSLYPSIIKNFYFSLISYNIMLLSWFTIVQKTKNISLVGTIWLLLGQILLLIVGLGIFRETITPFQIIGIGLASISLIFLSL